jgi:hypothetical protein
MVVSHFPHHVYFVVKMMNKVVVSIEARWAHIIMNKGPSSIVVKTRGFVVDSLLKPTGPIKLNPDLQTQPGKGKDRKNSIG